MFTAIIAFWKEARHDSQRAVAAQVKRLQQEIETLRRPSMDFLGVSSSAAPLGGGDARNANRGLEETGIEEED